MDGTYPFPPEIRRELELEQLRRTLKLAKIRCLSWPEIRHRLRSIWTDEQAEELLLRMQELQLTDTEGNELAEELVRLSDVSEQLHGRDRYRVDRRLIRLARALAPTKRYELAIADLNHSRKLRRVGAYKALREFGVSQELAPQLAAIYQETGDQELLVLIARSTDAIQRIDVDWLIGQLKSQYWRMRVIEGLIRNRDPRASKYLVLHPREFVHAVGRSRDKSFISGIRDLVVTHSTDFELLSLIAWMFGISGDREGVLQIEQLIQGKKVKGTDRSRLAGCSPCTAN